MQDKNIHIAKKLTDRGWGEMSKILDLEMPVPEQERRRFGWWWLLLGLSVGLASGVFAVKYFTQTQKPPVEMGVPIAAVTDSAEVTASAQSEAKVPGEKAVAENAVAPAEKSPAISKISSKKAKIASPEFFDENTMSDVVKPSPSSTFEKNTPAVSSAKTQPALEKLPSADPQNPVAKRVLAVGKIALLPVTPLPIPENPTPGVPSELAAAGHGKWAVYGSGMSSTDAISSGIAAGLMKSSALKNSRFSLEGGVGYAYMQQPLSVIFTAEEGSMAAVSTFTGFNTVLGDRKIASVPNASNNAAKLLKKLQLHYLEVPLAASYQFTPRFSVNGGLNTAILLSSSSDYTTGGIFSGPLNFSSLQADEAEASFDYNGEQPSVRLNHFDLAVTTGFDYRISPRLAAGLGYQFGLLDLIPDNGARDFNRLFRVRLRYNLTGGR